MVTIPTAYDLGIADIHGYSGSNPDPLIKKVKGERHVKFR